MSHRHTVPRQRAGRQRPPPASREEIFSSQTAGYQPGPQRRRYVGNPLKLKRKNKSLTAACLQIFASFFIVFIYFYSLGPSSVDCNPSDPYCPNAYFSTTYNEAREKFLKYSSTMHDSKTYHLPIVDIGSETEFGVQQTLFTDITIVNGNATDTDHLLIHIAGIHGIEGYAGSAIQCGILHKMSVSDHVRRKTNEESKSSGGGGRGRQLMRGMILNHEHKLWSNENGSNEDAAAKMHDFPVVMFVHALNPYGMYYGVQENERNVDLNRNLKTRQEWTAFTEDERNKHDGDIDAFLNPQYGIQSLVQFVDGWIPGMRFFKLNWVSHYLWTHLIDWYLNTQFAAYYYFNYQLKAELEENQIDAIFERYTVGQNYDAKGLQYVGKPEMMERSHVAFQAFLKERFKEFGWSKRFKKITILDVHTGGGHEYANDLITVRDDEHLKEAQEMGQERKIRPLIRSASHRNDSFANGIYKNANGMSYEYMDFIINDIMQTDAYRLKTDRFALMQHFGTYSREYLLNARRFAHAYKREYDAYVEQMDAENHEEVHTMKLIKFMIEYSQRILNDAFYVKDIDWKRKVLQGGFDVFAQLYRR